MKILENMDAADLTAQQPFAYWLHRVEKIGRAGKERLIELFGTPEGVYSADEKSLEAVLGKERMAGIMQAKERDIFRDYEEMQSRGILFYPYYHPDYPKKLFTIPDRPFGIYVKGRLPKEEKRSVAIVGARNCSEYGRYVAEAFAGTLAREGVEIISGMAKGIDGIAQKAALLAGGDTYAVLGCGVDICYPATHRNLYEDICGNGGILSVYPPKTQPLPSYFPPRNRIISGLSDVVLVVEARQKSGTLITVDMALEQGREVYVVPGRITDRLSDGCNRLLTQGAGVALSPEQLIEALSETVWSKRGKPDNERKNTGKKRAISEGESRIKSGLPDITSSRMQNLAPQEKALLSLLDFYPISLDQIRIMMQTKEELSSLTLQQTMEMLLKLSMEGLVQNEGGYYGLKKTVM